MPAIYGSEVATLASAAARSSSRFFICRNFLKRFVYTYLVRDFNVATVQTLVGGPLLCSGVVFGTVKWIGNAAADISTPVGTVMLATLPIILGFQLLLAAVGFDVANAPTVPLQILLRKVHRPSRGSGGDR